VTEICLLSFQKATIKNHSLHNVKSAKQYEKNTAKDLGKVNKQYLEEIA
jgi:hypothetical protein